MQDFWILGAAVFLYMNIYRKQSGTYFNFPGIPDRILEPSNKWKYIDGYQ